MARAAFWAVLIALVVAVATVVFVYTLVAQPTPPRAATASLADASPGIALRPHAIGSPVTAGEHPQIAHVAPIDLDRDGLLDAIACDLLRNRVVWIRQSPAATFTESDLGDVIAAPAHAEPVDIDKDGDLDILVASLGVLFPSNAKIGAVVVLENDGRSHFTNRVLLREVARVSDVRAGDLDGDSDLDLAVAQFGYNDGQTRWMRNDGGWKFSSTVLQNLSGPINVEIADLDRDGDLDITSLVSQEWEEVYAHVNDGHGKFSTRLVWGSTNDDFGSSWLAAADLDRDGDVDFVYSNGDAFDYSAGGGRPWHGIQWIENRGGLTFDMHRVADVPGAMSPRAVDLDGDGDIDIAVVSAYNDWDNPAAQSLVWLENDGQQRFALHGLANAPTHLITLGAGDFDGDGRADLITGGLHASRPYDRMSRISLWTR
jgi:FG-GAP-like repeat